MKKALIISLGLMSSLGLFGQQYPFKNPGLSSQERAKDLISRLTLQEKAALMCDQSDAIPRLGIKKFNWWSEALHGLANNEKVTVFPEPVGMAASFDDSLTYHIFNAVSDETRAKYNEAIKNGQENKRFLSLSVWTPNINIFRDPRWGRGQETYGEDPYLTSRMGVSVVKGLQGPADSKYKKLLGIANFPDILNSLSGLKAANNTTSSGTITIIAANINDAYLSVVVKIRLACPVIYFSFCILFPLLKKSILYNCCCAYNYKYNHCHS